MPYIVHRRSDGASDALARLEEPGEETTMWWQGVSLRLRFGRRTSGARAGHTWLTVADERGLPIWLVRAADGQRARWTRGEASVKLRHGDVFAITRFAPDILCSAVMRVAVARELLDDPPDECLAVRWHGVHPMAAAAVEAMEEAEAEMPMPMPSTLRLADTGIVLDTANGAHAYLLRGMLFAVTTVSGNWALIAGAFDAMAMAERMMRLDEERRRARRPSLLAERALTVGERDLRDASAPPRAGELLLMLAGDGARRRVLGHARLRGEGEAAVEAAKEEAFAMAMADAADDAGRLRRIHEHPPRWRVAARLAANATEIAEHAWPRAAEEGTAVHASAAEGRWRTEAAAAGPHAAQLEILRAIERLLGERYGARFVAAEHAMGVVERGALMHAGTADAIYELSREGARAFLAREAARLADELGAGHRGAIEAAEEHASYEEGVVDGEAHERTPALILDLKHKRRLDEELEDRALAVGGERALGARSGACVFCRARARALLDF